MPTLIAILLSLHAHLGFAQPPTEDECRPQGGSSLIQTSNQDSIQRVVDYLSQKPYSDLFQEKKWQELIWELRKAHKFRESDQVEAMLRSTLTQGKYTELKNYIIGGETRKNVLRFDNGIFAIFKPDAWSWTSPTSWFSGNSSQANAKSEIAAYRADRLLGLDQVPVTIPFELNGQKGSLIYMVKGATTLLDILRDLDASHPDIDSHAYADLTVFDYIIDNRDRNPGNWMKMRESRQIVAIDHANSFGGVGGRTGSGQGHYEVTLDEAKGTLKREGNVVSIGEISPRMRDRLQSVQDADIDAAFHGVLSSSQIAKTKERVHQLQMVLRRSR